MHTLFSRMTSIAASAVMAVATLNVFPVIAADSDNKVTVHFEFSDPDISIAEDDDGNIPEINDITAKTNDSVKLPLASLEKEGYRFIGWTVDGFYGFEPGDIYRTNETDVVMEPIFRKSGGDSFNLTYKVEMGGEVIDTSLELPDKIVMSNTLVKPSFMSYQDSEKKSTGWTDGEHLLLQEQKFIMPEHDVVLTPIWHRRLTLTYLAGDYDDIIGADKAEFDVIESQKKDIADASRFARKGYKIDHWHCEYDDKDYAFLSSFTMPDDNVTMIAVWVPVQYNIVFRSGISGVDSIKVPGKTGDSIKVPELNAEREGYTFGGWTFDGKSYMPGDDFLIPGAAPGTGIALTPVWNKEGEEPATTTSSTTTAPTTSATTTSATTSSLTTSSSTASTSESTTTTKAVSSTTTTSVPTETSATTTTTEKTEPESNYIKLEVVNEKGEPAKSVVIEYNHHITMIRPDGQKISTGPIKTLDTSKGNTVIHTKGTNEGDSSYLDSFKILTDVEEHTIEAIPEANIKETHDKDKNIDIYIITVKEASDVLYGDANCDGNVDLSDAVLIMQSLSNPSKYKLSEAGRKNADVTGKNDGVTNNDALAIQKYMLKLIDKLPEE